MTNLVSCVLFLLLLNTILLLKVPLGPGCFVHIDGVDVLLRLRDLTLEPEDPFVLAQMKEPCTSFIQFLFNQHDSLADALLVLRELGNLGLLGCDLVLAFL